MAASARAVIRSAALLGSRGQRPAPRRSPSSAPHCPLFRAPGQRRRGDAAVRQARKDSRGRASQEMAEIEEEKKQGFAPDVTELRWESPLALSSIRKFPDPALRAPNGRLAAFGEDLKKLAAEMFNVMYEDDGVGLAAPQVGVNVQLMVFNPSGVRGQGQEYILCNPRIISTGSTTEVGEEGCLSFPDPINGGLILGDVERHLMVKIKAQDENGQKFQLKLDGWEARIFQHEFDHLSGTLFVDRISPEQQQEAEEALEALDAKFREANPGVETEGLRRAGPLST